MKEPVVAIVGMATVDYLYNLPSHPAEDSENQATGHSIVVGGPAGRSSIAAARLGGTVRLLATCGTGVHSDVLQSLLATENVSCEWVVTEQPSQHSAILVATDKATRTTIWLPQPRADERLFSKLPALLDGADVVLLDCTDQALTERVISEAIATKVTSVIDTGSWKPWTSDCVPEVDHVVAPAKYFRRRAPQESIDHQLASWIPSSKSTAVVATDGTNGGSFSIKDAPEMIGTYRAAPVHAVDTCGAGDTFHGAYAYAIGAGNDISTSLSIAAWSAGLKTAGFGNDSIPTKSVLDSYFHSLS